MASATAVAATAKVGLERGATLIRSTKELLASVGMANEVRANTAASSILSASLDRTIALATIGSTPAQSRLLDLQKKQCDIFGTTYNPDRLRLGNKVLRQRLKGPVLAAYYPRKSVTIRDITRDFKRHNMETYDEDEEDRLEALQIARLRGKGAPKKKRTANTSKKGKKKK